MHKCLKCGRTAQSLSEISEGCTCGSKVFVFTRLSGGEPTSEPSHSITLIPNLRASPDKASASSVQPPAAVPADSAAQPVPPPALAPSDSASSAAPPPIPYSKASATSVQAVSAHPSSDVISEAVLSSEPVDEEPNLRAVSSTVASAPIAEAEEEWSDSSKPYSEVWLSKGGTIKPAEQGAPILSADPAAALVDSDVANVRQLKSGIYEIDVGRLKGEPLVIQDSDGIYYVRLPFVPLGEAAPGEMTKEKR